MDSLFLGPGQNSSLEWNSSRGPKILHICPLILNMIYLFLSSVLKKMAVNYSGKTTFSISEDGTKMEEMSRTRINHKTMATLCH